jgi:hypothetical protein
MLLEFMYSVPTLLLPCSTLCRVASIIQNGKVGTNVQQQPKYANLTGPSSVRWSCREAHSRSSFIVNSIHINRLQQQLANNPFITTLCGFHQARPSLVPRAAIMLELNQTLHGLAVHMLYCRPK